MIGNINNFVLSSQTLLNGTTTFTFEFDKPSGDFGAYKLYQSYDGITYTESKLRIDYGHYKEEYTADYTTESGGKVYFEFFLDSGVSDGRLLYFKLQAISISNELSSFSDIVQTYTAPTKPSNLICSYDGYDVNMTWDALSTSTGRNSSFTDFSVIRKNVTEINNSEVVYDTDTTTFTYSGFTVGIAVWIIDFVKRSIWFGEVTTSGSFTISSSNSFSLASNNTEDYTPSQENFRIIIENDTTAVDIAYPTTNSYIDTSFPSDIYYVYAITANGSGSKNSEETKFPIFTLDVLSSYPYLRSPGNSDNTILSSPYWRYLKETLIDAGYYDKTQFAIPYFVGEVYNLKGYLGVANCVVDVYVNDIYAFASSTGIYGEFDINYQFKKGTTSIKIQARDKFNIKFSRESIPYSIRTLNIYTWYSILGDEYDEIVDTITEIRKSISISDVSYTAFEDIYVPLIGITKSGTEDDDKFLLIATEIFNSYEYASYDESLILLMDAFEDNVDEFDHYEIYYNNSLLGTHASGFAYVPTSSGLVRDDYVYGISTVNTSTGAETDVTILRLDKRWWPENYNGINVLLWDAMSNATRYNVYKGSTEDDLEFMISIPGNVWVDNGSITPNSSITPRLFNYTSLYKPTNLVTNNSIYVTKLIEILKKSTTLTIIFYSVNDTEILELHRNRILVLLQKLIPPELLYNVIYAKDSSTQFLEVYVDE